MSGDEIPRIETIRTVTYSAGHLGGHLTLYDLQCLMEELGASWPGDSDIKVAIDTNHRLVEITVTEKGSIE